MRAPLLAGLLVAAALAGCADPAPDGPGPEWSFTDTAGAAHGRDEPAGNATVLFFMTTWCGTCKKTTPLLARVHHDYAAQGVRFYSLDVDPSESDAHLEAWKARYRQPWPHGMDPDLGIQRTFGVKQQSSVVALDAEGRVVETWGFGRVTEPALRDALDRALAAAAAAPTTEAAADPAAEA